MKKIILLFLISVIIPLNVMAEEDLLKNAKSGILIDADTGTILYEKNKDDELAVASLTKMMSQIIILENIENGNLSWSEKVTASANAAGMGGTQIWLTAGEKISVEDLFKGISMASANDATVALAERIAGTENKFVELMNTKAKELGLKNTNFKNCTGLDEDGHYSSAYDIAMIAKELLKHEEILKFSSVYEDYIRKDTPNKYWLVNTNKLVRFYEGADGLKTGFTDDAGYTMVTTAKRDNMRLIAVALGEQVSKIRNQEVTTLLDYGFNTYKVNLIKEKNDIIDTIKIDKANKEKINIIVEDNLTILTKKSETSINYDTKYKINKIILPIKKGTKVGTIDVILNNKIIKTSNLIVEENIDKISYLKYLYKTLKNTLSINIFNK